MNKQQLSITSISFKILLILFIPTVTLFVQIPTVNAGSIACGAKFCLNDSDCVSGSVCGTNQWNERMCMRADRQAACSASSIWPICCGDLVICGALGCNTDADCQAGLICGRNVFNEPMCMRADRQAACSQTLPPSWTVCCTAPPPPPSCGDGTCNGSETCSSCPQDCGACPSCGDGTCNGSETCSSCAQDCGACPSCGDGSCNGSETCSSCPQDCGACPPSCGDGACNGSETCSSCPQDCGACSSCGDGSCNGSETCNSCPQDCGACPPAGSRPLKYQGRVKIGNVVPQDGAHNFQFRIYTQATGGSSCWDSGSLSLTTSRGAFETELAVGTACSQFSGSNYWLEIAVDGQTLSPRELILPSPFTINTLTLSGFDGTSANLLGDLPLFQDNKIYFLGNTLGLPSSASGRRLNLYNAASNNQYLVGVNTSTVYFTSPQKFSWYTTNGSMFDEKLNFNGNLLSFKGNSRFNKKVNARDGYKCGGSDLAEVVSPQKFESGTVVCISSGTNGEFMPCDQEYSATVAGVVSENPGLLLNGEEKDGLKLALQGRVKVKVTNANGSISPGDELVSSSIPGYAMKGSPSTTYPVMIIGKALEAFSQEEGEILILVE